MKKAALIAFSLLLALSVSAVAETAMSENAEDLSADAHAIHKDNQALAKDQKVLEENRAAKASAKANDEPLSQAYHSVKIGANKATISQKKIEKDIDETIMDHDAKK